MIDKRLLFDIHRLNDMGHSARKIAALLGIGRKTVGKYLDHPDIQKMSCTRTSKLDPFKEKIDVLLKDDPDLSGEIVRQQIQKSGYTGAKSILYDYLKAVRPNKMPRAFIHFETEAGQQFQIDWGDLGCLSYGAIRRKLYCMAILECHSRMLYLELTHSQCQACVHQCLVNAFRFFGGTPKEIVTDNMLTAVLDRDGPLIRYNEAFLDFLRPFHILPRPCHVRQPQEKGKVERGGIGYIKQNFWPLRNAQNLDDLQQQANQWRDEIANVRIHGTTGERPSVRFNPQALRPLPEHLPDCRQIASLKVHKDFCVAFDANTYSAPPWLIAKQVILKADNHNIELYYRDKRVAFHKRSWLKHQRIELESHRMEALKNRQPYRVSEEAAILMTMGEPVKHYLEKLIQNHGNIRNIAQKLIRLEKDFGLPAFTAAIEHATAHNAYGIDYIENILNRQPIISQPPVKLKQDRLNHIYLPEPMLADYDTFVLKRKNHHERSAQTQSCNASPQGDAAVSG
jgi:transposase